MGEKMDVAKKKCLTPEGRVSFPSVFEPKSFEGQEAKFSMTLLFPKTTSLAVMFIAAFYAFVEKWGAAQWQKNGGLCEPTKGQFRWPKGFRTPFKDGNEKVDLDGYADQIVVGSSSKTRPGIVGNKIDETTGKLRIIQKDDASPDGGPLFYAGCYARATLIAFAYDKAGNKGVSFSLQNIQKLRDGKPFSGKKAATEEFTEVADASDDPANYEAGGEDLSSMGL